MTSNGPVKAVHYHLLLALAAGPQHGAEIRRRVVEQSQQAITLYPAMLYGSLDDLTSMGWIEESPPPAELRRQSRWRFYALTAEGRQALARETERLAAVVATARSSLRPT